MDLADRSTECDFTSPSVDTGDRPASTSITLFQEGDTPRLGDGDMGRVVPDIADIDSERGRFGQTGFGPRSRFAFPYLECTDVFGEDIQLRRGIVDMLGQHTVVFIQIGNRRLDHPKGIAHDREAMFQLGALNAIYIVAGLNHLSVADNIYKSFVSSSSDSPRPFNAQTTVNHQANHLVTYSVNGLNTLTPVLTKSL